MAFIKALFAASVLASLASAVPMAGRMDKRDIVVNTVTHTTWTTVDVTTTVYINDADPTTPPPAPTSSQVVSTTASAESSPPTVVAGNFAAESAPPAAPPASSVASSPAPQSTVDVTPKAAAGGTCEGQGNACTGEITYYFGSGGYGSCGTIIDDSANTIAISQSLMGAQSNGNPYCGRTVSIKGTDGSIHTATVVDKCMGCAPHAIDLTPALFEAVAPAGDGRVAGISWWFSG